MADEEQLSILKQGVEVWNEWRAKNSHVAIDLCEADLRGASLAEADLSHADLRGATLAMADLYRANLSGADLSSTFVRTALQGAKLSDAILVGANLSGADLTGAFLVSANISAAILRSARLDDSFLGASILSGADLSGASLKGVYLNRANLVEATLHEAFLYETLLVGADLSRADLSGARLNGTVLQDTNLSEANLIHAGIQNATFSHVDLSTVKGLEEVWHDGPSTIGIDTIILSQGKIPEAFLKGAGLPDSFIDYIHSLVNNPIDYYSCFISYSSKDQAFAERLYADLQAKGVRCWLAPHDMRIGDEIRPRIDESIRIHDKFLLVLSESSLASTWVKKEVETAFEKEDQQKKLVLFPVRLDEMVMHTSQAWAADIRRMRHIGDFTHWKEHDAYQTAFTRLLRDLKTTS